MSRLGLFSTVPRNQMVAIDRNFREFRGYSGSLLVCVCTSIARTCLDLTNGCCRTRLRWRSGTPQSQALCIWSIMRILREQTICEWAGVEPQKPEAGTKLGIALGTLGSGPINGVRHKPENGTNGWYIWCGEVMSQDDDFFSQFTLRIFKSTL